MHDSVTFRTGFWEVLQADDRQLVHLVLIATKPDIIKQAPLYLELKKRGELVFLGHTGQHYDFNLSGGLEEEFGLQPDFNLNIAGPLHHKTAQIIERLGDILAQMKAMGKTVIPYVHGDTTTAMAAGNAAWANGFAVAHVEAGVRTLTPKRELWEAYAKTGDFKAYRKALMKRANWERGSLEPYPEQFNTRATEPATGFFAAPTELNREFLLAEGYRADRIVVTGNTVADAMGLVMERAEASTVFEKYPALKDGFIRFCIHRRENCGSRERFTAIFEAMERVAAQGHAVLLISLFQTRAAVEQFGLGERLEALKRRGNFVCSDVWPFYGDVMAAMKRATVCATDSGSMQEEMNLMGVPCVTLRFGSDRAETALAGCNVIAPPVSGELVARLIGDAHRHAAEMKAKPLYGRKVSAAIVDGVLEILKKEPLFCFEHQRVV